MSIYTEEEQKVFAEVAEYEKEYRDFNVRLFSEIGATGEDTRALLDCATVTDRISFLDKPFGANQNKKIGPFKSVWLDEICRPIPESGDYEYSGHIYAKISKNKWLKIPFDG